MKPKACKRCGKKTELPFHTCYKPMKTINLTELLTPEQIKEVTRILNKNLPDYDKTNALKSYLSQFRAELEAKGVVYDYLSYVLIARHCKLI